MSNSRDIIDFIKGLEGEIKALKEQVEWISVDDQHPETPHTSQPPERLFGLPALIDTPLYSRYNDRINFLRNR